MFTHTWLARAWNSCCCSSSVVDATADLGLEEGLGRHGVGGLLPELCLPYLNDEGALEVSVLLALQIKGPEVPEPLLAVPVPNSPWVPAEHKGEAGLLIVDQLLGVSRLEALSPLQVVRVPVLVSSPPRDLVNPRQLSKQSIYDFRQSDGNFPETDQIREVFVVHEIGAPSQYYRQ